MVIYAQRNRRKENAMNTEISTGTNAIVKVGRNEVEVTIVSASNGKYFVKSNATGREFYVKKIERVVQQQAIAPTETTPTETVMPKKLSLLNTAANILKASDHPMSCKEMVTLAFESGSCNVALGKTPEQSLYSAIFREITKLGQDSRFRRSTTRGAFEYNK
jgi:hypothetical protein